MSCSDIFLGIGTNLGNREENLLRCLAELNNHPAIAVVNFSSIYETEPVGYAAQPDFLNMVICIKTKFSPIELLKRIKSLEIKLGRKESFRWGPRKIDIDILVYKDLVIVTDNLIIPHQRMAERRFVLVPLAEISPKFHHPKLKLPISELIKNCPDKTKVRMRTNVSEIKRKLGWIGGNQD